MPLHDSVEEYYYAVLRKTVASQCQLVGWQHVSSTALDLLVDLMRHHLLSNARRTISYCQLTGRTSAVLQDAHPVVASGIIQLQRFLGTVEPPVFSGSMPPVLPVPRTSSFNFLRPGSQEIVTRPIYIHEHLPPMLFDGSGTGENLMRNLSRVDVASFCGNSPGNEGMTESQSDLTVTKRSRITSAEYESQPLLDLVSVMMTTSGFISTSVEGKMPDTNLPEDSDGRDDGHGKLKTRKQKDDTYRRFSERENERKYREQQLWSNQDDPFDIIDVKVDEDVSSSVSSPEKFAKLNTVVGKIGGPLRRLTSQSASKLRRDYRIRRNEKYTPKQDGKNKLSIFRKKTRKNLKRLHLNSEKQTFQEESNEIGAPLNKETEKYPSQEGTPKDIDNVCLGKYENSENPVMSVCSPSTQSVHGSPVADADVNTKASPVQTTPDHETGAALDPDDAEFLNNPLIPRFSFPFASPVDSFSLAPISTFPSLPATKNTDVESSSSQPSAELRSIVSPSADSDCSGGSVSLSSPTKRAPGSVLTPLERLEIADKAEKKRDKEHKKNKKDKKDKKKKEKKGKERKEKEDKYEKRKKRSSEKTPREDDIVPKLTVRLTGRELSTDLPSSESKSVSPSTSAAKPVKEDAHKTYKKEKVQKNVALDSNDFLQTSNLTEEECLLKLSKDSKTAKVDKAKSSAGRRKKLAAESVDPDAQKSSVSASMGVITETVGSYIDNEGNQVWICPTCGRQDDGSPMIGCDRCDDWYHWICVGIQVPPDQHEDWFCPRCSAKQLESSAVKRGRPRSRKKH